METQTASTTASTRIDAARQHALGTLTRARETLHLAATSLPTLARGLEDRAGAQFDALLQKAGLVRIARVEAERAAAMASAASTETAAVAASMEAPTEVAPGPAEEARDLAPEPEVPSTKHRRRRRD